MHMHDVHYRTYEKFVRSDGRLAVALKKALYGCLQSALLWYNELSSTIEGMSFGKVILRQQNKMSCFLVLAPILKNRTFYSAAVIAVGLRFFDCR